jgi:hypothetical protein
VYESSLHAHLKSFYTSDGGSAEIWVEGYQVDVVKSQQLIEIQTGNFSAIKTKLENLLRSYRVCIVLPIALEKFIILQDSDHNLISRRRSPKKGRIEHLFYDLVYIARLAAHPNFSLEVLLTSEEEDRISDGKGSWRRKGISIADRRLVSILHRAPFPNAEAYLALLPAGIPGEFTNLDLSKHGGIPIRLASKMTYSLQQMGVLDKCGRSGRAALFCQTNISD